jgi:hypothetical protein
MEAHNKSSNFHYLKGKLYINKQYLKGKRI